MPLGHRHADIYCHIKDNHSKQETVEGEQELFWGQEPRVLQVLPLLHSALSQGLHKIGCYPIWQSHNSSIPPDRWSPRLCVQRLPACEWASAPAQTSHLVKPTPWDGTRNNAHCQHHTDDIHLSRQTNVLEDLKKISNSRVIFQSCIQERPHGDIQRCLHFVGGGGNGGCPWHPLQGNGGLSKNDLKIPHTVPQVSERYGLNVTWEVARLKERPSSFFSCSLLLCHLNGLSPLVKLLHLQDLLDAGVARWVHGGGKGWEGVQNEVTIILIMCF